MKRILGPGDTRYVGEFADLVYLCGSVMRSKLQDLVRELDVELIREHRWDIDLFEELSEFQRQSGILHGERPISPFLRPFFLEASRYEAIRRAAHVLSGAFESLTINALEYPKIADVLGLTDQELRFARFEPGYQNISVTSRLDTFLDINGFKFLEYNAENPAGIGDQAALEALYTRVQLVTSFLATYRHFFPQPQIKLLEALIRAYREWGGKKTKPNIAVVDWKGVDTSPEFAILKDFFESCGNRSIICDPSEMEYNGRVLRVRNFDVDIFYKRVIIHEFLDRFDETHPISRAMADRAVCMANSFRSKIPHKKSSFAILTDARYHRLFTMAQLEAIHDHIPWTRRVTEGETTFGGETIDLIEFVCRERLQLVLKPNDDYGGKGIVIGWECTESEWHDAINHALETPYVVQMRADVEKTDIPMFADGGARIETLTVDFDPFLFMGEVEGGMVRLASGSLVNITQGGGETALAVIEGY